MEDIKLRITRGKDQELYLTTKTMNEMVEKIIEWQLWENRRWISTKKRVMEDWRRKSKAGGTILRMRNNLKNNKS